MAAYGCLTRRRTEPPPPPPPSRPGEPARQSRIRPRGRTRAIRPSVPPNPAPPLRWRHDVGVRTGDGTQTARRHQQRGRRPQTSRGRRRDHDRGFQVSLEREQYEARCVTAIFAEWAPRLATRGVGPDTGARRRCGTDRTRNVAGGPAAPGGGRVDRTTACWPSPADPSRPGLAARRVAALPFDDGRSTRLCRCADVLPRSDGGAARDGPVGRPLASSRGGAGGSGRTRAYDLRRMAARVAGRGGGRPVSSYCACGDLASCGTRAGAGSR